MAIISPSEYEPAPRAAYELCERCGNRPAEVLVVGSRAEDRARICWSCRELGRLAISVLVRKYGGAVT